MLLKSMYLKAAKETVMAKETYFFSYSRKDTSFVKKLAIDLKKEGCNVWLDQLDIVPGSAWDDAIQKALNQAYGVLAIMSVTSTKSTNVMDEISYAIGQGKRIIPLVIDDCEVPFRLARLQYIDFTGNYDSAFANLLQTLNPGLTSKETVDSEFQKNTPLKNRPGKKSTKLIYIWLPILITIVVIVLLLGGNRTREGDTADNSLANVTSEETSETSKKDILKPWSESVAVITTDDGLITTLRAESLCNCISVDHSLYLSNGQEIPFEKMQKFEVLQADIISAPDAKANLLITLLDGTSVNGKVAANCDIFGYNDVGRFTTTLQKLKLIEFRR
jgi:hypothetical protein